MNNILKLPQDNSNTDYHTVYVTFPVSISNTPYF